MTSVLDEYSHNTTTSDTSFRLFEPMNVSLVKKKIHTNFPQWTPYINLTCNCLIFIIISMIGIIVLSVLNDAVSIMSSGKTVLSDLNLIIPEIKGTLNMLSRLCNHPNFREYCGNSNHTHIM